jgi:hypothetical protein
MSLAGARLGGYCQWVLDGVCQMSSGFAATRVQLPCPPRVTRHQKFVDNCPSLFIIIGVWQTPFSISRPRVMLGALALGQKCGDTTGNAGSTPLFPNDAPPAICFISTAESALAGIAARVPVGSAKKDWGIFRLSRLTPSFPIHYLGGWPSRRISSEPA